MTEDTTTLRQALWEIHPKPTVHPQPESAGYPPNDVEHVSRGMAAGVLRQMVLSVTPLRSWTRVS